MNSSAYACEAIPWPRCMDQRNCATADSRSFIPNTQDMQDPVFRHGKEIVIENLMGMAFFFCFIVFCTVVWKIGNFLGYFFAPYLTGKFKMFIGFLATTFVILMSSGILLVFYAKMEQFARVMDGVSHRADSKHVRLANLSTLGRFLVFGLCGLLGLAVVGGSALLVEIGAEWVLHLARVPPDSVLAGCSLIVTLGLGLMSVVNLFRYWKAGFLVSCFHVN